MDIEQWAAKAREELGKHTIIGYYTGSEDQEECNDEDVITLCEEYDKFFK